MQPNKRTNGPGGNQASGFTEKPARIVLTNGDEIHATHHFIASNGWVSCYTGDRQSGIDYRVPPENVVVIDTSDEDIRETTATASKRGEA